LKAGVVARLLTSAVCCLSALGSSAAGLPVSLQSGSTQSGLSQDGEPDLLRFAPMSGTTLRKTWVTSGTRELERLEVRTGDVTSAPQHLSIVLTGSKRLVVEDRYTRVEDGRPLEFTRNYGQLEAQRTLRTVTIEDEDTIHATETCDIEGRAVLFRWNGAGYARELANVPAADHEELLQGPDVRADALAGLAPDMDLLAFLPTEPVVPGAEWPVSFEAFRAVLRPGGMLACTTEPPEGEGERELAEAVWASLAGEVTARYEGRGDGAQGPTGRVTFWGTFGGSGEKRIATTGMTGRRMQSRMQVEGELVWDLARHRARSLTMTRTGSVTTTDDIHVSDEGFDRAFERELLFREKSSLEVVFEAVER